MLSEPCKPWSSVSAAFSQQTIEKPHSWSCTWLSPTPALWYFQGLLPGEDGMRRSWWPMHLWNINGNYWAAKSEPRKKQRNQNQTKPKQTKHITTTKKQAHVREVAKNCCRLVQSSFLFSLFLFCNSQEIVCFFPTDVSALCVQNDSFLTVCWGVIEKYLAWVSIPFLPLKGPVLQIHIYDTMGMFAGLLCKVVLPKTFELLHR